VREAPSERKARALCRSLPASILAGLFTENRATNAPSRNVSPRALTIPNSQVKINSPDFSKVPRWRNWQTRYVQVVVVARPWRFESSPGHHPYNTAAVEFFPVGAPLAAPARSRNEVRHSLRSIGSLMRTNSTKSLQNKKTREPNPRPSGSQTRASNELIS
jgi:hypothetical protein